MLCKRLLSLVLVIVATFGMASTAFSQGFSAVVEGSTFREGSPNGQFRVALVDGVIGKGSYIDMYTFYDLSLYADWTKPQDFWLYGCFGAIPSSSSSSADLLFNPSAGELTSVPDWMSVHIQWHYAPAYSWGTTPNADSRGIYMMLHVVSDPAPSTFHSDVVSLNFNPLLVIQGYNSFRLVFYNWQYFDSYEFVNNGGSFGDLSEIENLLTSIFDSLGDFDASQILEYLHGIHARAGTNNTYWARAIPILEAIRNSLNPFSLLHATTWSGRTIGLDDNGRYIAVDYSNVSFWGSLALQLQGLTNVFLAKLSKIPVDAQEGVEDMADRAWDMFSFSTAFDVIDVGDAMIYDSAMSELEENHNLFAWFTEECHSAFLPGVDLTRRSEEEKYSSSESLVELEEIWNRIKGGE